MDQSGTRYQKVSTFLPIVVDVVHTCKLLKKPGKMPQLPWVGAWLNICGGRKRQFFAQDVDNLWHVDRHVSSAIRRFDGYHVVVVLVACACGFG